MKNALAVTKIALFGATVVLGCQPGDRDTIVDGGGVGTSSPPGGATDGDAGGDEDDGDVRYDVGGGTGGPGDDVVGCNKADFLFIVDNSGSMRDEQQNLINSFPGFISTILDKTQAQDFHIMVADTDASGGGGSSTQCTNGTCKCAPMPACCGQVCAQSSMCGDWPCNDLPGTPCDGQLGAGKIFNERGTQCMPEDGPRYMTDATPDLGGTFACAATVGTFGSGDEQPMGSMGWAVGPLADPGECNDGFLRNDAILVVTFITDEEDIEKSPGEPPQWAQALIDAKLGNRDAVVVLGLYGDSDQPGGTCQAMNGADGADPAPRLRAFVEQFGDRGLSGSVCAADYQPFFQQAVDLIDLACDEFTPPG